MPRPLAASPVFVMTVLGLATSLVVARPLDIRAQDPDGGNRLVAEADPWIPEGLFQVSDVGYASVLLLSLAQLEPVEQFDEWTSVALSRDLRERNHWLRWSGRELGSGDVTFVLGAGPLVYGLITDAPGARRLGLHSLESLYTAAFLARLLKTVVGRARPTRSSDPDLFRPLTEDAAFHSFPSGHATRVFAVAAVFAQELADEAGWVPYVAYPAAAWTATTRIMDRAHWLTDVTTGALLGILTARIVEYLNHRPTRDPSVGLAIGPFPDGGVGLGLSVAAP